MIRAFEARGAIRNGLLCPHDKRRFLDALSRMPEGEVVIRIVPAESARRDALNRYWWACLRYVSDHTGMTSDELHDYGLLNFRPRDAAIQDGSSTSLSDREFVRMIEAFVQWAAEALHVVIPDEPAMKAAS
jgi:hypothetical protein